MNTILKISMVATLVVIGALFVPASTFAAYTMHGHTFTTASELAAYVEQYNRVYNELHDTTKTSTTQTASRSTQTTSTRAVKSSSLEVTTSKASAIDMYNVHMAGTVYFKGSRAVKVWFEYGPSSSALYYRSDSEVLERSGTSRMFDVRITGLEHNTTYYYRAMAVNEDGIYSYGTVRNVTTNPDPSRNDAMVKASTKSAKSVDEDRVFLEGSVAMKKATYATVWFEYGDNEDTLDYKTKETYVAKKGTVPHSQLISRLDDATVHYYRLVARDPRGVLSFGKLVKFTTKVNIQDKAPYIESYKVQNITGHDATASALFDMNDFNNGNAFMVYGEDKTLVSAVSKTHTHYKDIREYGDRLQKVLLDDDLDRILYSTQTLLYLDSKTALYVAFGIEYENEEGDDVIIMSRVQSFTTKEIVTR